MAGMDRAQLAAMGQRILSLRREHGHKQQFVAEHVGVVLRTYQFWQQGKSPPSQEHLEKLAELYGVEPRWILFGETTSPAGSLNVSELLTAHDRQVAEYVRDLASQIKMLETEVRTLREQGAQIQAQRMILASQVIARIDALEKTMREMWPPRRQQTR